MARLYLVRHGQTDWNKMRRYQGHSNIPLNYNGIKEANILASILEGENIDKIYSSDLKRALQTALIIGDKVGLEVEIRKQLREINFGHWEGKTYEEIMQKDGTSYQAWLDNPFKVAPPGGENLASVYRRVEHFLKEIEDSMFFRNYVVVTHGGIIGLILMKTLKMEWEKVSRCIPGNGKMIVVEWEEKLVSRILKTGEANYKIKI